uniref:Vacuolar ATPase assembly factor VMA21 n=4 Tax=Pteropodidae TaxID=9398 RepID=A0A7J8EMS4_ROUAE|nr:vacuolar ATPase assembly factor VMA21 [Rousettus aegyptiacus]
MLRGKSRLNVEWLGYSPGLLLECREPPTWRGPRNPGRPSGPVPRQARRVCSRSPARLRGPAAGGDAMERLDKAALNALQPPDVRNESSLASTLKTLLFFTALMITVPIGLYFTTKSYVFEGAFGMSNRDSYFYAAIVAVVAVHVVLALFVYVAWNEGSRQWREGKQD